MNLIKLKTAYQFSVPSILFAVFMLLSHCNSLPQKPEVIPRNDYTYLNDYLDNYIPSEMNRASVVGLAIGLVSDKEILFNKGFGFSDKQKGIRVSPETIFRTASVSKIVNLVITMKLVEEGKLDLDKDISFYLPEFKMKTRFSFSKPITIRSILTHHSGLPSERMKGFFSYSKTDSLEKIASDTSGDYLSSSPEFIFSYSNLGHSVLGRIIEKVSNDSYANLLSKKVFQPLSMKKSFYEINSGKDKDYSKGYSGIIFKSDTSEPAIRDIPAGFLNSTVNDISKIIQLFLNKGKVESVQYLKESTLKEIYKIQNQGNKYDDDLKIGLSFFINTFDFGDTIFSLAHGGDTFLFHAMLGILPKEKIGVIVLLNTDTAAPVVYDIAKSALHISLETKTGFKKPLDIKKSEIIKPDLSTYAGVYQNEAMIQIDVKDNIASGKLDGGVRFIFPDREDEWQDAKLRIFGLFTVNPPIQFKFKTVNKDKLLFIKAGGNVLLWGSKILSSEKINSFWANRVGSYKIINDDKDNAGMIKDPEIKIENGFLVLETNGIPAANVNLKQKLILETINDSEAIVAGLGRGKGDTLSIKQKAGREVLYYSGYEMEKSE